MKPETELKTYDYSKSFQNGKTFTRVMFIIITLLMVIALVTSSSKNYRSTGEFIIALLSLPLMPLGLLFFYYSYSTIRVNDDGIYVEFIGKELFVPWGDILSVKHYGSEKYGWWLVTTKPKDLTIFHRFYSLFTSFLLKPGIHIHREISDVAELVSILQRRSTENYLA